MMPKQEGRAPGGEDDIFDSFFWYCVLAAVGTSDGEEEQSEPEAEVNVDIQEVQAGDSIPPDFVSMFLSFLTRHIEKTFKDWEERLDQQVPPDIRERLAQDRELLCRLFGVPADTELGVDVQPLALRIARPTDGENAVVSRSRCTWDLETGECVRATKRSPRSFQVTRTVKKGISQPEALLEFKIVIYDPSTRDVPPLDACSGAAFTDTRRIVLKQQQDDIWQITQDLRN